MKTVILSFKPEWYEQIMSGNKIFEYRWQFPKEEVMAFIYVSRPVQQVMGYIYFSEKHSLEERLEEYKNSEVAVNEITRQLEHNRYVMDVKGYQETESITLKEIKTAFPEFVIPQSYYYLDNYPELFLYIKNHARLLGTMKMNHPIDIPLHTYGSGLLKR